MTAPASSPVAPRRAFVVDDSRAMRSILRRMLTETGFLVSEAANGREAFVRICAGETADVVLVDWNMPELNGYDFVRGVRADPGLNHMKLVMVTTETELTQVQRALDAGVDEYVMKPFTKDVIVGKLALLGLVPAES